MLSLAFVLAFIGAAVGLLIGILIFGEVSDAISCPATGGGIIGGEGIGTFSTNTGSLGSNANAQYLVEGVQTNFIPNATGIINGGVWQDGTGTGGDQAEVIFGSISQRSQWDFLHRSNVGFNKTSINFWLNGDVDGGAYYPIIDNGLNLAGSLYSNPPGATNGIWLGTQQEAVQFVIDENDRGDSFSFFQHTFGEARPPDDSQWHMLTIMIDKGNSTTGAVKYCRDAICDQSTNLFRPNTDYIVFNSLGYSPEPDGVDMQVYEVIGQLLKLKEEQIKSIRIENINAGTNSQGTLRAVIYTNVVQGNAISTSTLESTSDFIDLSDPQYANNSDIDVTFNFTSAPELTDDTIFIGLLIEGEDGQVLVPATATDFTNPSGREGFAVSIISVGNDDSWTSQPLIENSANSAADILMKFMIKGNNGETATYPLTIGSARGISGPSFIENGFSIDDVTIWQDHILTDSQIDTMWNGGSGSSGSAIITAKQVLHVSFDTFSFGSTEGQVGSEQCESAKETAWTVIGIMPVALFFGLFSLFSAMGVGREQ